MRRLCRFTAGFSIGCAACVAGFRSGAYLLAAIAAALCVLALGFRKQLHLQRLLPALLGLSLALAWCGVYRAVLLRPIEAFCARQQAEISAEVLEYPTSSRYGRAVLVCVEAEPRSIRAVLYYSSDETLLPGDHVACTAKLRAASPDNLERDEYYASRGVWMCASAKGELTVEAGTRSLRYFPVYAAERLKRVCTHIFPADAAGFLQALLTGDKQNLSYALRNDLSRSGVYHVVAVSGMHVSLLAGLVMLLCAKKRVLCAALGIPLVWFFVLLTGANASSVRAGIMQTMLLVSGLVRRERDPWTAFSAALLVLLAENPWSLRNVGLLLSFASTGGILLLSEPLYHAMVESKTYAHLEDHHPFLARGLRPGITATCCSLASSAFSLPICAVYFGVVSVSGFVTNALCLWLISLIFSAGLATAAASCICLPIGLGPGWLIGCAAQLVLGVIGAFSRLPYSAVSLDNPYAAAWTVFFFCAVWVICLRPKSLRASLTLGCIAVTFALYMGLSALDYRSAGFTFTALDVGQGQCLVYTADGETSIVDCGGVQNESGELAARYLEGNGVFRVERLFLTHPDADHCNGAAQLMSRVQVGTLYLPLTALREQSTMLQTIVETARENGTQVRFVREDLEFPTKRGKIHVLKPDLLESGNDGGLCVFAAHEKYDILITGDLSQNEEYRLLSQNELRGIELLVAGHHGAATSTSDALLAQTGARTVILSVGADNSYGHPAAQTLARIQNAGAAIYRTDEMGTIVIRGGN